jgi:inorganic pyrophosphatase
MRFDRIPALCAEIPKKRFGVHVIVETPHHTRNKFAFYEKYHVFRLNHTLRAGLSWPCDFGFIPNTLGLDGDPLDVALLIDEPCFPGCLVRARIVASFRIKKNGVRNDRFIACSVAMPGTGLWTDQVRTLSDLPERLVSDFETFLVDYSKFEGNRVKITGISEAFRAYEAVLAGIRAAKRTKP